MTRPIFMLLGGAMLLTGCGGSGGSANSSAAAATGSAGVAASSVPVPAAYLGTWGADCSSPFVKFSTGMIHVYPDNADYALKSATDSGSALTVTYDSKAGTAVETYEVEGDDMQLTGGTYGGQEATWHKAPMKKCG